MTQTQLNNHIGYIQFKHAKLAEDYAKSMLYGSRGYDHYRKNNNLIGVYIEILYRQDLGSTSGNSLSQIQIDNIIEDSYRRLNPYD